MPRDFAFDKHVFRHNVIPDRNEGLDIGLNGRRFDTIRAREVIADVGSFLALTDTSDVNFVNVVADYGAVADGKEISDGVSNGTTTFTSASNPWTVTNQGQPISIENAASYSIATVTTLAPLTVTGAADNGAGLIRITTSAAHGLAAGDRVTIEGVTGTTEANATWTVVPSFNSATTTFELQGSTFTNAYIAGGTVYLHKCTHTDTNSVPVGIVGQSITIAGAGAAGADLTTTVERLDSPTAFVLTAAARTAVSGRTITWKGSLTTTIASVTNAGSILLTVAPAYTATGLRAVWGTDNLPAFQAAVTDGGRAFRVNTTVSSTTITLTTGQIQTADAGRTIEIRGAASAATPTAWLRTTISSVNVAANTAVLAAAAQDTKSSTFAVVYPTTATSTARRVYVPPGSYLLAGTDTLNGTGTLYMISDTRLFGAGKDGSILFPSGGRTTQDVIEINHADSVGIDHLEIDGNGWAQQSSQQLHGIAVNYSTHVAVHNNYIRDIGGDAVNIFSAYEAGQTFARTENLWIYHNEFVDIGRAAVVWTGFSNRTWVFNNSVVVGTRPTNSSIPLAAGIRMEPSRAAGAADQFGIYILNNALTECDLDIAGSKGGVDDVQPLRHVVVDGNDIDMGTVSQLHLGLHVRVCQYFRVTNNIIKGTAIGAGSTGLRLSATTSAPCRYGLVHGNTIEGFGTQLFVAGTDARVSHVKITNNRLLNATTSTGEQAVRIANADHITFLNNDIVGAATHKAVYLLGVIDARVSGNVIWDSGYAQGISLSETTGTGASDLARVDVTRNVIGWTTVTGKTGVQLGNTATVRDVVISDNRVIAATPYNSGGSNPLRIRVYNNLLDTSLTGSLSPASSLAPVWTPSTPSVLTGDVNDYVLPPNGIVRLASGTAGAKTITGAVAGIDGEVRILFNVNTAAGRTFLFPHQSGLSSAANRWSTDNAETKVLNINESLWTVYDGTSSAWRIITRDVSTTNVVQFYPATSFLMDDHATPLVKTRVAQNEWAMVRTATGAETHNLRMDLPLPSSSVSGRGWKLISFRVWHEIATANLTSNTFNGLQSTSYTNASVPTVAAYGGTVTISMPTGATTNTVGTIGTPDTPVTFNPASSSVPGQLGIEWTAVMQNLGVYYVRGISVAWTVIE